MFKLLSLAIILLIITGCGASRPSAAKNISDRPSMIYQPDRYNKKPLKYPLQIGVLTFNDKRVMPFYMEGDFFQEKDMDGLTQMTYLELQNSGLFYGARLINEKQPKEITQKFLNTIHEKYNVDMLFLGDISSFHLFRHGLKETSVELTLVGQILYFDGGNIVWSGEISRTNKVFVESGEIGREGLSKLVKETLAQVLSDTNSYIEKTGKRMMQ